VLRLSGHLLHRYRCCVNRSTVCTTNPVTRTIAFALLSTLAVAACDSEGLSQSESPLGSWYEEPGPETDSQTYLLLGASSAKRYQLHSRLGCWEVASYSLVAASDGSWTAFGKGVTFFPSDDVLTHNDELGQILPPGRVYLRTGVSESEVSALHPRRCNPPLLLPGSQEGDSGSSR